MVDMKHEHDFIRWLLELERQIERLPTDLYDVKVKLRKLAVAARLDAPAMAVTWDLNRKPGEAA
jgi:hypothetical protein